MRHLIFFIIPLLLVQPGCSTDNQKTETDLKIIDVAGGVGKSRLINISDIADSVEYVPLETNPESILTPLHRIFYEKGTVYYPQNNGNIQIFDSKGKYVQTFNRCGRGPEEYEQLEYIDINNVNGNICIVTFKRILEYTKNGVFIKTIAFPDEESFKRYTVLPFKNLCEFYILAKSSMYIHSIYSAFVIDTLSKIRIKIDTPRDQLDLLKDRKDNLQAMDTYLFKFKDKIRVVSGNNEAILSIDHNLSVDTAYIINYGKYNIVNAGSEKITPESPYLWRKSKFVESNNYLFMEIHVGSLPGKPMTMINLSGKEWNIPISYSFFNKNTGEFTFLDQPEINQMGFADDIEGGPAIWPKYVSSDNYMISYIPAEVFIAYAESHKVTEKFKTIAAGLKETDNPVLVKVKLK